MIRTNSTQRTSKETSDALTHCKPYGCSGAELLNHSCGLGGVTKKHDE